MEGIECAGFIFYNEFDSANLARVKFVPPNQSVVTPLNHSGKSVVPELPDVEFNIWTRPDCFGTEFENGNRTWFYFGMKAYAPGLVVRLNIVNLNRQAKMYSQGMAPVYRIVPGKPHWERIRDKPLYNTNDNIFTLSFKFKTPENVQSITYFAFTYPFSYVDLQKFLHNIDLKYLNFVPNFEDDIYYTREVVCHSLQGREVTLITISSYHGITTEQETRLKNLFPNKDAPRPCKFLGKKIIFVSARVHPGETPSTFVFNGFLNLLLTREDPVAVMLRKLYVFKLIPFLNPDGVALGHYRTDTRGVNLNRMYLNPLLSLHPPVFAARALIRYHHFGFEKEDVIHKCRNCAMNEDNIQNDSTISAKVSHMTLEETQSVSSGCSVKCDICGKFESTDSIVDCSKDNKLKVGNFEGDTNGNESGLFLYLDLHGHASKKGIFMYGNHFEGLERNVECMLLPKLMSMNNHNFHFTACNFTERNMYHRDRRDGMSREGSGRVAVLKLTGLIRSYTLECNYNTGRIVNVLPPTIREPHTKVHMLPTPPKYTTQVFEEVGKSLGASILDLTNQNPCTRIPNSEFHSLSGLRDWLRINCGNEFDSPVIPPKMKLRNLSGLRPQGKPKQRPPIKCGSKKTAIKARPNTVPIERKENVIYRSSPAIMPQPSCSQSDRGPRIKSGIRLNKTLAIRSKSKKDFSHKIHKHPSGGEKPKLNRNKVKPVTSSSARLEMVPKQSKQTQLAQSEQERSQLREICFIKTNEGKGILSSNSSKDVAAEDEVMVPWNPSSCNSTGFGKNKSSTIPGFIASKLNAEAGPSKQGGYLAHGLAKSSKAKFKKLSLRRLANTNEPSGKVEKAKKRKKLKSK